MSYWQPTVTCLRKMIEAAGFSKVKQISTFMTQSEDKVIKSYEGVFHAFV